ncbi:DMT family transporter [Lysinibacillus irui]|uniref:DMT family transporter n=1 Tax=Lysinibacillus irui TaxID=2998077 RepID=A0AAJ5RQI2_9BACI|nr:DMT family transporter [Lysinibacillus irui]WDV09338.1 DMT family transporter [Lysinibacillus irui]
MNMNKKNAEFLMLTVALAWGCSYLMMKVGLDIISPFNLIALRFGIAFVCLALIFLPRFRELTSVALGKGILMGVLIFLIFACLSIGVDKTAASTAAFLASTTVIIVPILECCLKRILPNKSIVFSVLLVIVGLYLLTVKDTITLDEGAVYCLFTALFYAIYIIILDRIAKKENTLLISIIQLGVDSLLGVLFMLCFETPTLPQTTVQWGAILGLGIFCSAYGFLIQPIAQRYTSSERIGLIFSLEPLFAAIISFIFLHEILDIKGYIGATLIFSGVVYSQLKNKNKKDIATTDIRSKDIAT